MKRIYQGRVSSVQIINPDELARKKTPWVSLHCGIAEARVLGEQLLWRHHELFQDAINYYLVGLLALASRENPVLGSLLAELDKPDSPRQIWNSFTRRGKRCPGLSSSVAKYLTAEKQNPTMTEAFAAILAGNEASADVRDSAVTQLMEACDGPGAIQQEGRSYWPKFCDPDTNANYANDPIMYRRSRHQILLPQILHNPETKWDSPLLNEFDVYSIATPDARKLSLDGADALGRFHQAVAVWRKRRPDCSANWDYLESQIGKLPADISIQGYVGSSAKGEVQARLFAWLLFAHVDPSPFTFDILRSSFPIPKENAVVEAAPLSEDSVRVSRGKRGFVFPAFTSLKCWQGGDNIHPTWKLFDIEAFKYALTAVNQVEERTKERNKQIVTLEAGLARMHGDVKGGSLSENNEESELLPVLKGDPRISLLRDAIANLRVDTALTDGDIVAYGVQRRTVRGFRELRRIWRDHAPMGTPFSPSLQERLREDLRQFQIDNASTIGSETLFRSLLEEKNWPIWQEPDPATASLWINAGFAENPLDALVQESEMKDDIACLSEPVKITPAHPETSRRQYDFNAVSKFKATTRSANRHEPGACAFSTEIAVQRSEQWCCVRARISYSAPRLLRDGLRSEMDGESLADAPWTQPMMEALVPVPNLPQDITDMPVMLMPDITASGVRRVLLNFPVTLDPEKLITLLGKRDAWFGQFCRVADEPFALRWPADGESKGKKGEIFVPWFDSHNSFTVLGVDLGTRDAGALAHLAIAAGSPVKSISRFLGDAGGKSWYASLTDMRLIKLSGEDATVFVNGKRQTEPYGEKGRMPSAREIDEAREIIIALGQNPDEYLRIHGKLSFPELNDKLLVALRRAQGRLARLQGWSWKLLDGKEAPTARGDIVASGDAIAAMLMQSNENSAAIIAVEVSVHRERVSRALVQIANRILPLRRRRWVWQSRADLPSCHVLSQTEVGTDNERRLLAGQRGLSHRRIEQIEELRHRCQSLNRAFQHVPGVRPRMGRITKGAELPDPCPDILEKMGRLREQRVDQTAHAILAAALGVRLHVPSKDRAERERRDIHGEYERFRAPVDFIAIENLSRYLSSQDRSRFENTNLMRWCHRQLVQKLRQLCESYGIPVLTVPAAYSSRFSSRDGSAGFRAVEVSSSDRHEWPWRHELARLAQHEAGARKLDSRSRDMAEHIRQIFDQLDTAEAERLATSGGNKHVPRTLFAPLAGGPIFIPLGEATPMQADLNAAANIALRAIAAPDRHDIHQRVRTERKGRDGKLQLRRDSMREKARWRGIDAALSTSDTHISDERQPNLFTDVARVAFGDQHIRIEGVASDFATGKSLWAAVKSKAWARVARLNEARIRKWREELGSNSPVPGYPEL